MEAINPPCSDETEQDLISAIIGDPETLSQLDGLQPQHFYRRLHADIFHTIVDLKKQGLTPNVDFIAKALSRNISEVSAFLDYPPAINPQASAKSIINLWTRRELIKRANAILKRAQDDVAAAPTLDYAYREIMRLMPSVGGEAQGVSIRNVYTAERMIDTYREYLKNLRNNQFKTGIRPVDEVIRGVAGGEVLTIIARAGSFKTALLQNMLYNYARQASMGAVFFSLEMPIASMAERFFQILDGETGREVERMFCGGCDTRIAEASINQFKTDLRHVFIVPTKVGLAEIPEYIRIIEEETGIRIGVVGIDYLGLLDSEGENEYQQISSLAKGLKRLAKGVNLPVVVLSQVSRKGGDGEIEVSLDMGRGSGQIEEGADFVLGLWQLEKPDIEGAGYDLVCRILKNRKGPKGKRFILDLDPPTLRFSGDAIEYTPPKKKKSGKEC